MALKKLAITSTTEQLRLAYDASHYTSFTVNANGQLTITPQSTYGVVVAGGLSVQGELQNSAVFSGAASFEAVSTTTSAGISIYRNAAASVNAECFILMAQKDAAGTGTKTMSISSKWVSTAAADGYSCLRINSTYNVASVQTDDIGFAHFGGHGISFWPPDFTSTYAPGHENVWMKGKLLIGPYDAALGNVIPVRHLELRDTQPVFRISGRLTGSDGDLGYVEFQNRASPGTTALFGGWRDAADAQMGFRWYTYTGGANRKVGECRHTGLLQWWDGSALADVVVGAAAKTTAGAPYANDGYIEVKIGGTTRRLMTTA